MIKRPITLPTVFLDRDGTLIREADYLRDPKEVKLLAGVADGLRRLKQAGFSLVVVSNQSGVARGIISRTELKAVQERFFALLKDKKVSLDGYYWCPHLPEAKCSCRKPRAGMLRKASRALHIPWRRGVSVGDRPSDVHLAQKAGGWGVLLLSGYGRRYAKKWEGRKPDYIAPDFKAFAKWLLAHIKKDGTWTTSDI